MREIRFEMIHIVANVHFRLWISLKVKLQPKVHIYYNWYYSPRLIILASQVNRASSSLNTVETKLFSSLSRGRAQGKGCSDVWMHIDLLSSDTLTMKRLSSIRHPTTQEADFWNVLKATLWRKETILYTSWWIFAYSV